MPGPSPKHDDLVAGPLRYGTLLYGIHRPWVLKTYLGTNWGLTPAASDGARLKSCTWADVTRPGQPHQTKPPRSDPDPPTRSKS